MPTFLLTWNPDKSSWDDLDAAALACGRGEVAFDRWSCGSNKRIEAGDHFLMLRQRREPCGIFAHGTVIKGSYPEAHWDDATRTALYVDLQFDGLVDPTVGPIIPRTRLDDPLFAAMHWDAQGSGTRVPDDVAAAVRQEWQALTGEVDTPLPEEFDPDPTYVEGARRMTVVNAFERNAEARNACLAHHGTTCAACGDRLLDLYGEAARGLIHVHHLRPVSTRETKYRVNPIEDLRPVCPNCHAVIHRKSPPYSIEEVRIMFGARRHL